MAQCQSVPSAKTQANSEYAQRIDRVIDYLEGNMNLVDGIGGVFLFSNDLENPEIQRTMAWAIMRTDQDIKDRPRTGQINYRVKNMAEVLSHLKSKGVAIEKTAEYPSYGNFAWVKDPEGNKIELWEPCKE